MGWLTWHVRPSVAQVHDESIDASEDNIGTKQKDAADQDALHQRRAEPPDVRYGQGQDPNVDQDARDRYAELREEEVDAGALQVRLPDLRPGRALEGRGEDAGQGPRRGEPAADVAADADASHGEDAVVQEQDRDFVHVDPADVDDFGSYKNLEDAISCGGPWSRM